MKSHLKLLAMLWTLFVLFPVLTFAQNVAAPKEQGTKRVTFYAMGDTPYTPEEDLLLPKQIENIPSDADFVVHVGDIKPGKNLCDTSVYNKVFGMLSQSEAPLFIIPGDNEWNDCIHPDEAWELWQKYFMRFDRQWQHGLPVFRHLEHEENFSFVKNNVLFIGLNLVGGRVHDAAEWEKRHADNLDWVRRNLARSGDSVSSLVLFVHAKPVKEKHNDFFEPFSTEATKFNKPILLLHGDGHRWIYDRPFKAKNILRVEVDQGLIAPPLKVTVTNDPANPFQFDRRNGKPVEETN